MKAIQVALDQQRLENIIVSPFHTCIWGLTGKYDPLPLNLSAVFTLEDQEMFELLQRKAGYEG
jgi:hypothetical protein